jgi:hypothetical protein
VKFNFENGLPGNTLQFPASRWEVSHDNPLQGQSSLKHAFDNTQSDMDVISFSVMEPDIDSLITCSFIVNYNYNPSGSNNWCFYFLSEGDALQIKSGSYFHAFLLGVNQDGTDDSLYVYHYKKGEILRILNCGVNCENDIGNLPWEFRITIRNNSYLLVEGSTFGEKPDTLACLENYLLPSFYPEYLAVAYNYTSSKDRLLSIDEICFSSSPMIDTLAPVLENVSVYSPKILKFRFNENIFMEDETGVQIKEGADSIWVIEKELYLRLSEKPGNETELEYVIPGISDRKGNSAAYRGEILYFYPGYHDIIFTEIMSDPSPPVYLPEREYLEIFNRSGHPIDLSNWELITGNRVWVIPEFELGPREYLIFCEGEELSYYSDTMNYLPLFSSSSVLSNSGQELFLYSPHNILIDALEYSANWYGESSVYEGGWSLERIDLNNLCGGQENWKPSEHRFGGTPGFINSVNGYLTDYDPPFIEKVVYVNDSVFLLGFSEVIDADYTKYKEEESLFSNPSLDSIYIIPPFFRNGMLKLKSTDRKLLVFQDIWRDCEGNTRTSKDSVLCKPPGDPFPASIIISEILFAPWPGCPEFIELYNASEKVLSLYDLKIYVGELEDNSNRGRFVCDEEILFYPGDYLLISQNPAAIRSYYEVPEEVFMLNFSDMQSLPDKGATITLYDRSDKLVDEFTYSPDDHFPLINDFHGISLERVFMERETGLNSEWHSASSLAGFATPGFRNSQFRNPSEKKGDFYAEEKIFTPNNDGDKDLALINIRMDREGYLAMIRVFDAEGRMIRWLGNNLLLGTHDKICWDGRDDMGRICPSGIYLVHMDAYHLSGIRKAYKEAVVVGR